MSAQIKAEIVRLIREEFDPRPPNYGGYSWDDGAEAVADNILAALVSDTVPEVEAVAWISWGGLSALERGDSATVYAARPAYDAAPLAYAHPPASEASLAAATEDNAKLRARVEELEQENARLSDAVRRLT